MFVVVRQYTGVPGVGPEVGTHFGRDAAAFVTVIARLPEYDVNVVALFISQLAVDALSLAHIRVVGLDHEGGKAGHSTLAERPRLGQQILQDGAVRRNLSVTAKADSLAFSVRLELVEHLEVNVHGRALGAEVVLGLVLLGPCSGVITFTT